MANRPFPVQSIKAISSSGKKEKHYNYKKMTNCQYVKEVKCLATDNCCYKLSRFD